MVGDAYPTIRLVLLLAFIFALPAVARADEPSDARIRQRDALL